MLEACCPHSLRWINEVRPDRYSMVKFMTMPLAACESRAVGSGNRQMMA
jgi:hypothetical protein